MKNPFRKSTVSKALTVYTENYFFPIPSQAIKTYQHFDRFNVNHYIKILNQRNDNLINLQ